PHDLEARLVEAGRAARSPHVIEDERHWQAREARLELHPVVGLRDVDLEMPAEWRNARGERFHHRRRRPGRKLIHYACGAESGGVEPPQVLIADRWRDHGDAEKTAR